MHAFKYLLVAASAGFIFASAPAMAKSAPPNWDGLVEVKAKQLDLAYLLPGADFRPYTKVLLDEPEAVAENFDGTGQVRVLKSKTAELLGELGISQDEKLHQWVMDRVPMLPQRDLNMLHLLCKDLARKFGKEV